ncbi:MAG: transposase [Aestuariivita sp.]|nr:transposase [Aestuariivita sp.]
MVRSGPLDLSVALSEIKVHWLEFRECLHACSMHGTVFIVSDDHAELKAARRVVLGAATWQRCQFHLAQNAVQYSPNTDIRKQIGR